MRCLILQLAFLIGSSLAIYVHEECEARSKWEIPYNWTDIDLSVWVPPSEQSTFLTVEIEFEDFDFPIVYDSVELSRDKINLHHSRDGSPHSKEYNMTESIAEGWANFKFIMHSHYGMMYLNNDVKLPFSSEVEYMPRLIRFKGSNITLNCPSGQKMWKISNLPIHVPFSSTQHRFSLYSTRKFLPLFSLEMRQFSVGWDNEVLTTIPTRSKPLPPFEKHNVSLSCNGDIEFICIVQFGENATLAEEFSVGNEPQYITIKSKNGDPFILILQENDIPHLFYQEIGNWIYYAHITEAISLGILVPAASILIYFLTRRKNMYKEWYLRHLKITVQSAAGEHQHERLIKRAQLKSRPKIPGRSKREQKKSEKR